MRNGEEATQEAFYKEHQFSILKGLLQQKKRDDAYIDSARYLLDNTNISKIII